MTELSEALSRLQERFPVEAHRERDLPGGGIWYYIPWQAIRDRLNEVAPGQWSIAWGDPQYLDKHCYIKARLTIHGWTQEAIGNAPIELISKSGKDMSRGNPIERAIADALKNAAEMFGVAAYLDEQADTKTKQDFARWMRSAGNPKAAVQLANQTAGRPERSENAQRIRGRRDELGLSREQVVGLMKTNFKTDDSTKLSVGQVDQLLKLMDGLAQTLKPQSTGDWESRPADRVSQQQIKQLFATAQRVNLETDAFRILLADFQYSSTKDVSQGDFVKICEVMADPKLVAAYNAKLQQTKLADVA
jgi:hypothetical protein